MITKFRVFCEQHKCIEEVYQITYLGDNDIKVEAECLSGYVGRDFILMQSTGLYDCTKFEELSDEEQNDWLESGKMKGRWRGREIFEGDVLSAQDDVGDDRVVVFYDGHYLAQSIKSGYGKFLDDVIFEMEVIGNRYMNPELLEAT